MSIYEIISTILNLVFASGFLVTLVTLRSERKKADAQAKEAELMTIEKATGILMSNIVTPLREELYGLRKDLRRLRKAIDKAKTCSYAGPCPVTQQLQTDQICDNEGDCPERLDSLQDRQHTRLREG